MDHIFKGSILPNIKNSVQHEQLSEMSETKSFSARKSLFKSPIQKKQTLLGDECSSEFVLLGWIQRQTTYIKALEKEISFYRVRTCLTLM